MFQTFYVDSRALESSADFSNIIIWTTTEVQQIIFEISPGISAFLNSTLDAPSSVSYNLYGNNPGFQKLNTDSDWPLGQKVTGQFIVVMLYNSGEWTEKSSCTNRVKAHLHCRKIFVGKEIFPDAHASFRGKSY